MASRYATRPGRPSINSSARHNARRVPTDGGSMGGSRHRPPPDTGMSREEDESTETSEFPIWKTVVVVAVVVGCFATVYPKMFHPMLLYALGYGQQQNQPEEQLYPHPAVKHGSGNGPPRSPHVAGHSPQSERPHHGPFPGGRGPMPGMGAMHPGADGRSSKSVWHWMLPFYTVGVILFLLYTLSKILWKKPKKKKDRRRFNLSNEDVTESDEVDEEVDEDDEDADADAQGGGMNSKQLRQLQLRLQDTERSMHEILGQLEQLSTTADPAAAEHIKKTTMETLNGLGKLKPSRKSADERNVSDSKAGAAGDHGGHKKKSHTFDSTERRYLSELQKALADFKQFTETYIEEHSQKQQRAGDGDENDAGVSGQGEEEGSDNETVEHDVDVMEAEKDCDNEQLKVEEGEGELIAINEEQEEQGRAESDQVEKEEEKSRQVEEQKNEKQVRKRKGRQRVRHEE